MKYGFEKEYFVADSEGKFVLCPPELRGDECGFLAEARGEPHEDPFKAAYLFLAEEEKLKEKVTSLGLRLLWVTETKLSTALLRDALRRNGKPVYPTERGNIYGLDYKANDRRQRAGLHVHVSNERQFHYKGEVVGTVSSFFDFVKIIQKLDGRFKKEIKQAWRLPGFYEIKSHGFEYRSLPMYIDPREVAICIAT